MKKVFALQFCKINPFWCSTNLVCFHYAKLFSECLIVQWQLLKMMAVTNNYMRYIHDSAMALALIIYQPVRGNISVLFRTTNPAYLGATTYVVFWGNCSWTFYRRVLDSTELCDAVRALVEPEKRKKKTILLPLPVFFFITSTSGDIRLLIMRLVQYINRIFFCFAFTGMTVRWTLNEKYLEDKTCRWTATAGNIYSICCWSNSRW